MLTANNDETLLIVFFLLYTETGSKLLSKKKPWRPNYRSSNSHAASHQFSIKVFPFKQEYYCINQLPTRSPFFYFSDCHFSPSLKFCALRCYCSFGSVTITGQWSARHVFDNLLTRPLFAFLRAIIDDFVICWLLTAFNFDPSAIPFLGV